MLSRDADVFLNSLSTTLFAHTSAPDSVPTRNAHFFHAAKSASIARLVALDRIIPEFEKLSKEDRTTERMFEEDQLLFDFFANAHSSIESFCFGAYFLGTALEKSVLDPDPDLLFVTPKKTLKYFRNLYSNSPFTKMLRRCIWSQDYRTISAIRNMLSHRLSPGRTIRPMMDMHSWNLDQWYEGEWSSVGEGVGKPMAEKEFQIESKSLTGLRDWLHRQLELLGKRLQSLAAGRGLRKC
jgi:hypothetical protein